MKPEDVVQLDPKLSAEALAYRIEHLEAHERARQLAARDAYNQSIGILVGALVAFVVMRYVR